MAVVKRDRDAKLLPVLRDHRRPRVGAPADEGLGIGSLDLGELGAHVGVLAAVPLIGYDFQPVAGGEPQQLGPA